MKDYVKDLYKRLSENIGETPELFHYDYFKLEGGELYYIGSRKPLTTEGKLKPVGMLADILGKNRLCRLGFNIPVGKLTARQAIILNKAAEELPSESDIIKADDIELQEIVEKASGIILISTLSIFHTFPATCHLALLMVCTFHSSLDMHDAAHTMMISDIATSAWLIDSCHKAI